MLKIEQISLGDNLWKPWIYIAVSKEGGLGKQAEFPRQN